MAGVFSFLYTLFGIGVLAGERHSDNVARRSLGPFQDRQEEDQKALIEKSKALGNWYLPKNSPIRSYFYKEANDDMDFLFGENRQKMEENEYIPQNLSMAFSKATHDLYLSHAGIYTNQFCREITCVCASEASALRHLFRVLALIERNYRRNGMQTFLRLIPTDPESYDVKLFCEIMGGSTGISVLEYPTCADIKQLVIDDGNYVEANYIKKTKGR